jgi:hypothetical protein
VVGDSVEGVAPQLVVANENEKKVQLNDTIRLVKGSSQFDEIWLNIKKLRPITKRVELKKLLFLKFKIPKKNGSRLKKAKRNFLHELQNFISTDHG